LTNINLALGELAAVTKENEEAQLFEKMIDRNSSRIADLIDELLKSARPPELEKIPFLLDDIVEAALHFCKDRMELLDVQLNKQFDITEVEGEWDPDKLKIALVNIFINAIEAMTDVSHPILTVTLQIEDDQPLISIQDNGKGMSTETINNLYDPFFTKRKNGLGLGMTATFNIIQMHKGKIYVDSEVDKGTVFKIYV
jgi:C4-dicarboxylate-specific signal transduction histidine kinase